jgi:AraC family transcriptional regulator of adaptative response / DNA-3-methyladenine glycosylase II
MLDPDTCYAALKARDARFDGLFFVAVSTTGIYCRPVCPARTPGKDRCSFFGTAAEADRAGFRACFRCRPELAPGSANVDAVPRLVADAMARIDEGALNDGSVDDLAAELGVTARHLRRAFDDRLGISPIELAQSRRLALAKQLLHDTSLGLADVAFASGFSSVRRFNDAFRSRFGRPPGEVRRQHGAAEGALTLRLLARRPFDGARLLAFLRDRAIPGVERVEDDGYARIVRAGERWGVVRVRLLEDGLSVDVDPALGRGLMRITARLRVLFDLDARPDAIAQALSSDPILGPLVAKRPGLRVPGAFDPFEAAARAILGQQVSVKAATTLAGRVAERFGAEVLPGWRRFPSAREIAAASVDELAAIGLPGARAATLRDVAAAFTTGVPDLVGIRGVGDWTRQYVAMRARHDPDAFPAGDLGVKKALGLTEREALARSEAWRPWRAYAVMHLWTALSEGDLR